MVTQEFRESCTEIVEILKHVDKSKLEKIPYKTRAMFLKHRDLEYKTEINFKNSGLDEQNLKKKTNDILVYLYLNYWSTNGEKEELESLLTRNYETNQKRLKEKYNPDEIFKNKNQTEKNKHNKDNIKDEGKELMVAKYNETIFKRIINKLKDIFKN